MKRFLLAAFIWAAATTVFAQNITSDTTKTDSLGRHKRRKIELIIRNGEGNGAVSVNDTVRIRRKAAYPKFSLGITIARLDLGLATLVDNGSFTLSKNNSFLNYRSWKSSNAAFDVFQMGARFSNNFRIYLSAGFDWTLIRLNNNITILPNEPVLTSRQDNIDYSKNRFSSSYLRVPLAFDFRTNPDNRGKRAHFVIGPEGGFLLGGMVKQISSENGKQKFYNDYNFTRFRYGVITRVGYGAFGIFAKYYMNDMFENSPQQAGLKDFSFGIMLGF